MVADDVRVPEAYGIRRIKAQAMEVRMRGKESQIKIRLSGSGSQRG